jgi:hypothetical protein
MRDIFLPKANKSKFTGNAGINRISQIFNDDFRWIFRKVSQEDDFGIDGFADIVTDEGHVTGQSIAVQVKHGSSYFAQRTDTHITFNGELKHLNYYHNISVPVLIILSDPEGDVYWKHFDVTETEQTKSGWKIEIPKASKMDGSSKARILSLLSPFVDVMEHVNQQWAFNSQVRESSIILYHIDPDDIRSGNADNLFDFIKRLSATPDLTRSCEGKLELFTSAYDDDPREVWEIKPMIRWVKEADKKGIPWFFFCNKSPPHVWLRIYTACLCGAGREGVYDGGRTIKVNLKPKKISKLLNANFLRLNEVCEAVGVSEDDIRRISFGAAEAMGLPIHEMRQSAQLL